MAEKYRKSLVAYLKWFYEHNWSSLGLLHLVSPIILTEGSYEVSYLLPKANNVALRYPSPA